MNEGSFIFITLLTNNTLKFLYISIFFKKKFNSISISCFGLDFPTDIPATVFLPTVCAGGTEEQVNEQKLWQKKIEFTKN